MTYKPSKRDAAIVERMIALVPSATTEQIAQRLKITAPTVRKYFPDELAYGRTLYRHRLAEHFEKLFFVDNVVAAGAKLVALTVSIVPDMPGPGDFSGKEPQEMPAARLGKKEIAALNAEAATVGKYTPRVGKTVQ